MLKQVVKEMCYGVRYTLLSNLYNFAELLLILLPYGMYFLGQWLYVERGYVAVGGEMFVPVLVLPLIYILKGVANKAGKGKAVPVPRERFTDVSEDGEVTIRTDRTQELILYIADLEDYLERKGLL